MGEQAGCPAERVEPRRAQAGGAKPGDRAGALGRRASGLSALAVELGCNVTAVALFARTVATVTLVGLVGDEVRKNLAGPVPATPRKSRTWASSTETPKSRRGRVLSLLHIRERRTLVAFAHRVRMLRTRLAMMSRQRALIQLAHVVSVGFSIHHSPIR